MSIRNTIRQKPMDRNRVHGGKDKFTTRMKDLIGIYHFYIYEFKLAL